MFNSNKLPRLPNYLKRFGVPCGLRLYWQIEEKRLSYKSTRIESYRVPGYAAEILLRDSLSDHAIFWQCMVMEQYAIDHFPHAERLQYAYQQALAAGKPPVIIDCGGNIGLSALWFARSFPEARVVVVEPDSDNFALLKRNTAHLQDQVIALQGGVWSRRGYLRIVNPDSGSAAFRVECSEENIPSSLRAYTLDELHRLGGGGELLIVKVDIEGSQKQLFAENTDWVANAHLITIELDDWLMPWQGTSRSFFACLSQYPFEYLLGGESIFCFQDIPCSKRQIVN